MFLRKFITLPVFVTVFAATSLVAPLSVYAFSVSPSVELRCDPDHVFFQLYITNNEQSDTLVATVQSSVFNSPSTDYEGGTIAPGVTQPVGMQTNNKSVSSGTITVKYYKQNNPGTLESQNVSFGSISCPMPTAVPTAIPTPLPTDVPAPTVTSVPTSTNNSSSTGNTGVTNTPAPTQKPTIQNKPTVVPTNTQGQSYEKDQKNTGIKTTPTVTPHVTTTKPKKPTNTSVFTMLKNLFGGFFSFFKFR